MKATPTIDPQIAFADPDIEPDDRALKAALGGAFAPVGRILADVAASWPDATSVWQYSKQAGWYRISVRKRRRLFYLVPQRGSFRLSLILGDRALASLQSGPQGRRVEQLLRTAKRYPEGTAFAFGPDNCDPGLIAALLAAKLAC